MATIDNVLANAFKRNNDIYFGISLTDLIGNGERNYNIKPYFFLKQELESGLNYMNYRSLKRSGVMRHLTMTYNGYFDYTKSSFMIAFMIG